MTYKEQIDEAIRIGLKEGLSDESVTGLIPLVEDFASATGQTVDKAMQSVMDAITDKSKYLMPFQISFEESSTIDTRVLEIQEQLKERFIAKMNQ